MINIHKIINFLLIFIIVFLVGASVYAATRAIVPRADGEGTLGTAAKQWGVLYTVRATTTDSMYVGGILNVTGAITGALTGNASTATASADNPTDCAAGSYPLGVDANWDVENCTDATTEINSVVNGLGGTNLTCSGQSCSVDDAFITDGASDTMTGTLTVDGLTLGANENITLGAQTLDHDGTTFVFNDDVNITGSATSTISNNLEITGNASTSALFINGLIDWGNGMCQGEDVSTTTPNITIQACSEF